MCSDNPVGADNQQERLVELRGWIIGFVDGEGCFSVGFTRQPNRVNRKGYKLGYQVNHRFAVTQGVSSIGCLEELHSFFGVGRVFLNRRRDNHKEDLAMYSVDRREDLLERIIPFFQEHPLHTAKRRDFERFVRCMHVVADDRHRTPEGLIEIAEITQTMNHRKSRQDLIRILRGHTLSIQDTG